MNDMILRHSSGISPEIRKLLLTWIASDVYEKASKLIDMEKQDEWVAYVQLLNILSQSPDSSSLAQEVSTLYDKIFYVADSIESDEQGNLVVRVWSNGFVRLNDKIQLPGLPMVNELRSRSKEGVLFSWVGAIQIDTKNWIRIPLLQRDAGAPSDAGKYTLPAGRADKSPWLTAYEEVLEEIVLFAEKEWRTYQVVPFIQDGWISEEKAKQLASIARGHYINSILKWSIDMSLEKLSELISADYTVIPLHVTSGWNRVKTIFSGALNREGNEIIEDGFFPVHDEKFNTYEMVRWFRLDLRDFNNVTCWDGDGFGRNAQLVNSADFDKIGIENMVTSLQAAIKLGVFKEE